MVLVVVLGIIALVLDRLWLDMASEEAQGVAEAAALAAARELASDDDLRFPEPAPEERIRLARTSAENVATMNRVAGQPFDLDSTAGDVQFGVKLKVDGTDEIRFVETIHAPRHVRVTAQRSHARGNSVSLFLRGITGVEAGEIRAISEATIDNCIVGMQSVGGTKVPVLPMSILWNDPTGRQKATWREQIVLRRGQDHYRYNITERKVEAGSDGIPEIVLSCESPESTNGTSTALLAATIATSGAAGAGIFAADALAGKTQPNLVFLRFPGPAGETSVPQQIQQGLGSENLDRYDGRILITPPLPKYSASLTFNQTVSVAMQSILGECRAAFIHSEMVEDGSEGNAEVQSAGLIAGRVMAVIETGPSQYQLVFQPGILATRCAMTVSDLPDANWQVPENKYVFQLKLSQ